MRKTTFSILTVAVLLLTLSLAVLLPSGAITEEALVRYQNTSEEEEDISQAIKPVAVLASAVFSDILPSDTIDSLPIDRTAPGKTPIASGFTESGYRDDSIIVEMEQRRIDDSDVFIAFVKIANPTQLRTAIAGKKLSSDNTNQTTRILSNYNGIVGMNGDYFSKTKAGYIVRMGESYREQTSKNMDLLLIDELGDFHILTRGHDEQKRGLEAFTSQHQIINGFFFGPALVIDGAVQEIPSEYQFDPGQPNPRAGIGQIGPLTYAMVVVNGRTDESVGVTMAQFAQIMADIGCQQAYNLDGGNSATLAFNGSVYNTKPQAERGVQDIIYFASATGEE
ncbi:MAG: phosphodiester glycosidase family protein [Eubacteriales bacterium]|nr:phosphodiester glycosidase family protein [Eubacteriales bacterium]